MFNRLMRIIVVSATFLGADSVVAASSSAKRMPQQFKLIGIASGEKKPADFKNKVVLLQFWASWCVGCHEVMQSMIDMKGKNHLTMEFVPVSVDESMKDAQDYFDKKHPEVKQLKTISYLDVDTKLATGLGVSAVPALVLVDASGKVLMRLQGHPSQPEINKLVKTIEKAQKSKVAH